MMNPGFSHTVHGLRVSLVEDKLALHVVKRYREMNCIEV